MVKRGTIWIIVSLVASSAMAQSADQSPLAQKAISRAKHVFVSQLEPGMPKVTLEHYLQTEAGTGAQITWEMNDCGEQTGNPADQPGDVPTCAEGDVRLPDGETLRVMIAVGSVKNGIKGKPKLFDISISRNGSVKALSRLSQIAIELHRKAGS